MIPSCPSLMYSFNGGGGGGGGGMLKELTPQKLVFHVCVYLFCLCSDWFCGLT